MCIRMAGDFWPTTINAIPQHGSLNHICMGRNGPITSPKVCCDCCSPSSTVIINKAPSDAAPRA